ncbi:TPA: hypothetical protein DEW05_05420 [Candidatus Saccharibacteria bacterium]|nr:hypothetical protein [Candidatus Saccharibacteria bacterium]
MDARHAVIMARSATAPKYTYKYAPSLLARSKTNRGAILATILAEENMTDELNVFANLFLFTIVYIKKAILKIIGIATETNVIINPMIKAVTKSGPSIMLNTIIHHIIKLDLSRLKHLDLH